MANVHIPTPTETYDPSKCDPKGPAGSFRPIRSGPYMNGTRPDHVYFRTSERVNPKVREAYEKARTPFQTDVLNNEFLSRPTGISPLGDPVPFAAYLIGRIANDTNYRTQFNLDSDRGYGYLTWDWIRTDNVEHEKGGMHDYKLPVIQPAGDERWIPDNASLADVGATPLQLHYVDVAVERAAPTGLATRRTTTDV